MMTRHEIPLGSCGWRVLADLNRKKTVQVFMNPVFIRFYKILKYEHVGIKSQEIVGPLKC